VPTTDKPVTAGKVARWARAYAAQATKGAPVTAAAAFTQATRDLARAVAPQTDQTPDQIERQIQQAATPETEQ
jgi:hypothetical protein